MTTVSKAIDVTFSSLDPSQKSAFKTIDNDSANLHIVHGPPGTGKSQLVVSLLERLASENKKVLFVSQNTEALKVIERMISRTETAISYPNDGKYVSLLDFCLMLYNPNHRYLKYLREQYTRVNGKILPHISSVPAPNSAQYTLKYTNLNHDENYNVQSEVIGFDELVAYYTRYVDQVIAPEPIRAFDQVDVRAVLNTLDVYPHPEYFPEFNRPRRELILLSTKNINLALPEVRVSLKSISDTVVGTWTKAFSSRESIDVVDYLELLKEYKTAVDLIDLYKFATENKDSTEFTESLGVYLVSRNEINKELERIDDCIVTLQKDLGGGIDGVSHESKKIKLSQESLSIAEKDLNEVLADRDNLVALARQVVESYPDIVHVGVGDLWVGLVKVACEFYKRAIDDESGLFKGLSAPDIDRLNKDLDTYYGQNSVKRMISGIPASFKTLLHYTSTKELNQYRDDYRGVLSELKDLLEVYKGSTIQSLLAVCKKNTDTPLSRMDLKLPDNLHNAKEALLPVHRLVIMLQKYSITKKDFSDTKRELEEFDSSLAGLQAAVSNPENKKIYLKSKLEKFISIYNTTIEIEACKHEHSELKEKQKELQNEAYRQNGQYLANVTGGTDYASKVDTIHEYLSHKKVSLSKLLKNIVIPDQSVLVDVDLDAVQKTITDANLSDNFSDYFFEISKGQTIDDWLDSVGVLETYNNDAEVVDFVEHNKSINKIRTAMGSENTKYIDEVLNNDITFSEFAARIVNVIVNESFGRASISDKKRVSTKELINSYDAHLNNQKAITYQENLRHIYSQSMEAAKELSKQSTLQAGGKSTMDRFRHSTHLISSAFPIICATPKDVSKYVAANKGMFDYVIFDEASQLLPGQAIPSIYRAKKAVIIGDPHQMPPSLNASLTLQEQSEDEFDDLGESILDLVLKQPQKQHHLKVHYRSKYNKLFEPSRESIYSNDGIEPIFEAELAQGAPIDIVDDLGEGLDQQGYDKNFHKICESLNEYIDHNNKADFCILFTQGGVLSKFKDFLTEVGEQKYNKVSQLYNSDKILVSTVTNCQGIEGAYTLIYMHHYQVPGAMWFFKESAGAYKRLNVSITRQREGLKLLLADPRSHWIKACDTKINQGNTGPNTRKSAELMKSLLTNAGEQADTTYLDRRLGQNANWFDSPLTEQLYDKLNKHYADKLGSQIKIYSEVGWNLLIPTGEGIDANERNVGFRIDLGVYSIHQKKFILGIEMDGAMYHSGFDKEHSDYTRQIVLEEKGWDLYRIWSTNWLNDNEREFDRLIQKIDNKLQA